LATAITVIGSRPWAERAKVLLTIEETLAALEKASTIKYRRPGDEKKKQ
jgi:hypothetical protein